MRDWKISHNNNDKKAILAGMAFSTPRERQPRAEITIIPCPQHFVNRKIAQILYRADPEICATFFSLGA